MSDKKPSRFNNMKLGFQRREMLYEAIMIDLYLAGVLSKDKAEAFIGREISPILVAPNGVKDTAEVKKPEVKAEIKTEAEAVKADDSGSVNKVSGRS